MHGGQIVLSKATAELLQGQLLTDLGEHRLKDIEGAVSIHQLGDKTFPPLKTISNTNLPRPASSFIGREQEREDIIREFREGARLLTLTGPGGSGKTRLAVEAAADLVPDFKAGVFWIGLAALRDPTLVTETVSQILGAGDGLAEHIGERDMLLLLDNLEQVVEAAPDLSALLTACPNLTLLCTSRELLRIHGEVEYAVPPLAESEAIALFCERARLESSEDISTLCSRLDNLPLALELAASRTKALAPAQILERLSQRLDLLKGGRDADPRQQTLRATIAWSYDLLSVEEQRLFRSLSVFAGGCTLEAAEAITAANIDTLQSLVEKSLLRFSERYWMLQTISEYAVERLEQESESSQIHERHAHWYSRLATSAHAELRGPSQAEWLERLDPELENLRGAIHWAQDHDPALEVELAGASWFFLVVRGLYREALGFLVHALETAAKRPFLDQNELLYGASYVALMMGDNDAMEHWCELRLELGRARGDASVIARSLVGLGLVAEERRDLERAGTLFGEAAEAARGCGDRETLAHAVTGLGGVTYLQSDAETARGYYEQALELRRELSDVDGEARALIYLAGVALLAGDSDGAAPLLVDALRLMSALGDMEGILVCLGEAAEVAVLRDDAPRAARMLGAADALRQEIGYGSSVFMREGRTRIESALDENDPVLIAAARAEGGAMTLDEAVVYALEGLESSGEQAPPA
jgi:predicted ATPase